MTLQELNRLAKKHAGNSGIAESDYWFILTAILNRTRSQILLNPDQEVAAGEIELVIQAFNRLEKGEPPQYIVGKAWFRNLELVVSPAVLIPRPETELLIDILLPMLKPNARILEIGTGSGAIAIALKSERPDFTLVATELADGAIEVAKINAAKHRVNIDLRKADLFPEFDFKFACLISNPPYISSAEMESLEARVKEHEPKLALWGGKDGLLYYKRILEEAVNYIQKEGFIAFEHGYMQKAAIKMIAGQFGWTHAETYPDLNGKDRFSVFIQK